MKCHLRYELFKFLEISKITDKPKGAHHPNPNNENNKNDVPFHITGLAKKTEVKNEVMWDLDRSSVGQQVQKHVQRHHATYMCILCDI